MPNTLKALLLIPLALLASCATGPKLTPEMEALRQSLNQRMANTSSTEKKARAFPTDRGVATILTTKTTTNQTHIRQNGDIDLRFHESIVDKSTIQPTSGAEVALPTFKYSDTIISRLPSSSLPFLSISLKDNAEYEKFGDSYDKKFVLIAQANYFTCVARLSGNQKFRLMNSARIFDPPSKIKDGPMLPLDSMRDIVRSPDKAFIQGIVRDMNRFIELYKALPK